MSGVSPVGIAENGTRSGKDIFRFAFHVFGLSESTSLPPFARGGFGSRRSTLL